MEQKKQMITRYVPLYKSRQTSVLVEKVQLQSFWIHEH